MTKKELEQEILTLENHILASKNVSENYQQELVVAQKQLANINKPELTSSQFDDIYEAIELGVSSFDFSDQNNFDTEFELDYDNKVTLSNLDLTNSQDLVEVIVEKVHKLFVETTCPEDEFVCESTVTTEKPI